MEFRYVSVSRDIYVNEINFTNFEYTPKDDWACQLITSDIKINEVNMADIGDPTPRCREVYRSGEIEQCQYCNGILEWVDEAGVYGNKDEVYYLSICKAPLNEE